VPPLPAAPPPAPPPPAPTHVPPFRFRTPPFPLSAPIVQPTSGAAHGGPAPRSQGLSALVERFNAEVARDTARDAWEAQARRERRAWEVLIAGGPWAPGDARRPRPPGAWLAPLVVPEGVFAAAYERDAQTGELVVERWPVGAGQESFVNGVSMPPPTVTAAGAAPEVMPWDWVAEPGDSAAALFLAGRWRGRPWAGSWVWWSVRGRGASPGGCDGVRAQGTWVMWRVGVRLVDCSCSAPRQRTARRDLHSSALSPDLATQGCACLRTCRRRRPRRPWLNTACARRRTRPRASSSHS
jgi:hypothetical protein